MKWLSISLLALLICKDSWAQNPGDHPFRELEKRLGNRIWTSPEKRLVRATIYEIDTKGADSNSQARKGNEKVRLRYASEKEVGTVSAPSWLPRGSVVRMKGKQGYYVFVAADVGDSVENGKAARKSGKNKEQRRSPVFDFCIKHQHWPDFVQVELYYFCGKVGFEKLSKEQQGTLFDYARKFFQPQPRLSLQSNQAWREGSLIDGIDDPSHLDGIKNIVIELFSGG